MYKLPEKLGKLVNSLSKLPSIGPKSAQRLAFYIVKSSGDEALDIAESIREAVENIRHCDICANITDRDKCDICSSEKRDKRTICVVENPQDVISIESSENYNGMYHVLLGSLSPLDGIEPEDLRIKQLTERVGSEDVEEVILALDPNVEGEATAAYIREELKDMQVKVTQLAYGIPMGGNLEYADGVTLGKALEGRKELK